MISASARTVAVMLVSCVVIGCASACGDAQQVDDGGQETTIIESEPTDQADILELQILDALDDEYPKGVAWDVGANLVVVTVFTAGRTLSDDKLTDYAARAGAVAGGSEVVVRVSAEDAPVQDQVGAARPTR
ncbi:MAG: hypothetical protein LBD97_10450 [Bifidobacteriaceae bacterium]|nr:hypothetical protein [Bifidobacteriaceae bacterium]